MNDQKITTAQAERYREIIGEIHELLDEAKKIVRCGPRITSERARSYCHAHIATALDKDHEFLGSDMFTMEDIADELDGAYWHSKESVKKRDADKDMLLKRMGYKVIRFSETEIKNDVSACVNRLLYL